MKRKYNYFMIIVMVFFDVLYIFNAIKLGSYDRLPTYLALFFTLLVPTIVEKIFKLELSYNLKIIYFTFIFIADFLGCVVGLYNSTVWFDVFAHFLSGILTALLGIFLMKLFNYKETKFGSLLYALGITCLIAILWEMFEFGMDTISGTTLQHVPDTGVNDTMEDVIAAFMGSLVFLIVYFCETKQGLLHKFTKNLLPNRKNDKN